MPPADSLARAANFLRQARRALFVTGAGISADSGLPTYRGVGGLYEDIDTESGIPIETALSGAMFKKRPELTWKHIHHIEAMCRSARPNAAHAVIARLEQVIDTVWVLTQNVDGFHHQAGSTRIIDIHGDVHDLMCTQCASRARVDGFEHLELVPRCRACGGLIRPDVVLFGELLPLRKVQQLEQELARGFDVVFSVGTTSLFPYVAQPVVDAHYAGTPTVEINPGETAVSHLVDIRLPLPAAEALSQIWEAIDS